MCHHCYVHWPLNSTFSGHKHPHRARCNVSPFEVWWCPGCSYVLSQIRILMMHIYIYARVKFSQNIIFLGNFTSLHGFFFTPCFFWHGDIILWGWLFFMKATVVVWFSLPDVCTGSTSIRFCYCLSAQRLENSLLLRVCFICAGLVE